MLTIKENRIFVLAFMVTFGVSWNSSHFLTFQNIETLPKPGAAEKLVKEIMIELLMRDKST